MVYVTVYMALQCGKVSPNPKKLTALAAFLKALEDPWLVAADWNINPKQMCDSGNPKEIEAVG